MEKCVNHPGRNSTGKLFEKEYCAKCHAGISAAVANVDAHVEPNDCFVWYESNDNWQPITGTGCAHWISHQLNISIGPRGQRCLAGFTFRVKTLAASVSPVRSLSDVKVNDIWIASAKDHMGLVVRVTPPAHAGDPPAIIIKHDSSRQGGVRENSWDSYFSSGGGFFR